MSKKTSKKKVSKKYEFTLTNINYKEIDIRYGFSLPPNILSEPRTKDITLIDDLVNQKVPEMISFLDDSKNEIKCSISMIDYKKANYYNCFWDRHPLPNNIQHLGCPIKYVPHQIVKTYCSEISKDKYTINENVPKNKLKELDTEDKRLTIKEKGYYMTDGAFCSFNCCMAYINDMTLAQKSLYRDAKTLLLRIYNELNDKKINKIEAAPHWRTLYEYGGNMSIEQFRDSFNKIEYKTHGEYIEHIKVQQLGMLFEEKLRFS